MTMLMTLRQLNDSLGRTQTSLVLLHGFLDIFQTSAHDQRLRSRLEGMSAQAFYVFSSEILL